MRISDWSSDVCSSDLLDADLDACVDREHRRSVDLPGRLVEDRIIREDHIRRGEQEARAPVVRGAERHRPLFVEHRNIDVVLRQLFERQSEAGRSEEHTSELQSLMRISYAVFCLKKKTNTIRIPTHTIK